MTPGRLRDAHNRTVEYARVSLTHACDFRCAFCKPAGSADDGAERLLDDGERRRLCRILAGCGVRHFKITGGEPFMAEGAVELMAWLKTGLAAESVTVTTNGSTLDRHAVELATAGVDCVNVSLNAVSRAAFQAVTGSGMDPRRIMDNVLLAKSAGLAVKLNMVPIRGLNDGEVIPLAEFAVAHRLPLRFIELMPVGPAASLAGLPYAEVRRILEERFGPVAIHSGRLGNGPAVYFGAGGGEALFGHIAAISRRFCAACNRARLTAAGFLRTCLHHEHGVDLAAALRRGESDRDIARRAAEAVASKPGRHFLDASEDRGGGGDFMFRIGG